MNGLSSIQIQNRIHGSLNKKSSSHHIISLPPHLCNVPDLIYVRFKGTKVEVWTELFIAHYLKGLRIVLVQIVDKT